jgi:hypothetical protein
LFFELHRLMPAASVSPAAPTAGDGANRDNFPAVKSCAGVLHVMKVPPSWSGIDLRRFLESKRLDQVEPPGKDSKETPSSRLALLPDPDKKKTGEIQEKNAGRPIYYLAIGCPERFRIQLTSTAKVRVDLPF